MSLDWENPAVLGLGRLPNRTTGFGHATRESAFNEDPGASALQNKPNGG